MQIQDHNIPKTRERERDNGIFLYIFHTVVNPYARTDLAVGACAVRRTVKLYVMRDRSVGQSYFAEEANGSNQFVRGGESHKRDVCLA